jgi:hypothetical protein
MTRGYAILAALVCVVIPAASWLDGSGFLAWTMFSGNRSYRLEIAAVAADGSRRALAPTELARYVGIEEAPYFVSADVWRMIPYRGLSLRLAEAGRLACRLRPTPEVEITLFTRRTLDAPVVARVERVRCEPSLPSAPDP